MMSRQIYGVKMNFSVVLRGVIRRCQEKIACGVWKGG